MNSTHPESEIIDKEIGHPAPAISDSHKKRFVVSPGQNLDTVNHLFAGMFLFATFREIKGLVVTSPGALRHSECLCPGLP